MPSRSWRAAIGLALVLGVGAFAAPLTTPPKDAWPVFRGGPHQTGLADATLSAPLQVLWKFSTGDSIEGAPAVRGGVVYLGSLDEYLYALDLKTGAARWKVKAGPIKASPAVKDGLIFVGNVDGAFQCFGADRGDKRWSFDTGAEIVSGADFAGDRVLFGSFDDTLYCLGADGKPVWKFKTQGPVNGSPAVAGGHTFAAGCDSALHVVDVATGKETKSVDLGSQSGASAALQGDFLYVGTMGNEVQAIDWKKGAIAWTFRPEKRAQAFYSSAAVADGLVVIGSRDKRVYGLDQRTGKEVWSFATGGRVDCSPVIAGGRVYVGSFDGKFYVLDLKTGREVQRLALDGPVTGSPAVAAGRLLIGTQKGTLYCLGKKD